MADLKHGDRVRVTFEGTWSTSNGTGVSLGDGVKLYEGYTLDAAKSVEKIDPPVEVFKPGDVVRDKRAPEYIFAIGKGGYLSVAEGQWWPDSADDTPWDSRSFERVNLE